MFINKKKENFSRKLDSNKFNEISIEISLVQKKNKKNFEERTLISNILTKCLNSCKDIIDTKKYYLSLYDMVIKNGVRIRENGYHEIFFVFNFLKPNILNVKEYNFDKILDCIIQILFYPKLEKNDFLDKITCLEKKNLINSIKNKNDDKQFYAYDKLNYYMFKDTPFELNPYGNYKKYNELYFNLFQQYKKYWKEDKIEINYLGFNKNIIDKLIFLIQENLNNNFNIFNRKISENNMFHFEINKKYNEIIEVQKLNQSKLAIGYLIDSKVGDEDYFVHKVANEILGGNSFSKLFQVVREKNSLCYFISSKISLYKGAIFINSGIDTVNLQKAKNLIIEQVYNIQSGNISKDELLMAKKSLATKFHLFKDNIYSLYYLINNFYNYNDIENIFNKINKITIDDIVKCSLKWSLNKTFILKGE